MTDRGRGRSGAGRRLRRDEATPEPPSADEVEDRLRRTMNTILYGAAAVLIVFALVSASSGGGGTLLLLAAGAGLIGAAVWRTRSTGETGPTRPRLVDSDLRVTDQDVEKAASFSGTDLTLDEICRLTRPGSAWWSDSDKRAFRVELERRLGDRR